jgi:transcriptional regulator with XRE-family HTH domain
VPRPRLQDVADLAGVSLATASRVLNGSSRQPGPELVDRVRGAAAELGYVVNAQAQALARSRSGLLGLVVHDISDPYFSSIAAGAQAAAREHGRLVLLASTGRDPVAEREAVAAFAAHRVDAVVVAGTRWTPEDDAALAAALAAGAGAGGGAARARAAPAPRPRGGAPGPPRAPAATPHSLELTRPYVKQPWNGARSRACSVLRLLVLVGLFGFDDRLRGRDRDVLRHRSGLDRVADADGQQAVGGGVIADLRHMAPGKHEIFKDIVLKGALEGLGMGNFSDVLSEQDADAIHAYVIARANEDYAP